MSKNYFKKYTALLVLPVWVFICFYASQYILLGVFNLLSFFKISLASVSQTVLETSISALVYVITIFILILVPKLIKKWGTSMKDIGLDRLPTWTDIIITPAGMIIYLIFSSALIILFQRIVPNFDIDQVQNVGFKQLNSQFEYLLAFSTLVVIAPVAEEVLFRGYLFGKLKKQCPVWLSIIVTSLLFGFLHGNLNVMVDTFALSIILCILRVITGSIWPSILLHMLKNGIAFYILFINPTIFNTLVK